MKRNLFFLAAILAVFATASTARADLQIIAFDGSPTSPAGDSVTYTGTGVGAGLATVTGVSSVHGTTVPGVATYFGSPIGLVASTLNVSGASFQNGSLQFGVTESANVPGAQGYSDLSSQVKYSIINNTATTQEVTFRVGANPFNASMYSGTVTVTEGISGLTTKPNTTGTITLQTFITSGNTSSLDPTTSGTQYGPTESLSIASGGFVNDSVYQPASILGTGNFSIGQLITVSINAGGSVGFTVDSNITPEPATLAVWGCGLGLIGLVRRRRRAAQAAA